MMSPQTLLPPCLYDSSPPRLGSVPLPDGETEAGREGGPGEALPPGSLTAPAPAPDLAAGRLGTLSLF